MCATADPSPNRLAVRAGVGGARQHRVLGGHPSLSRTLAPAGHALGHRCGAQDAGLPELDQHRSLGVTEPAAGDRDGTKLIGRAAIGADHGDEATAT